MQYGPIAWLMRAARRKPAPADGKRVTRKGWTTPKTPVEILAESLRTGLDWQLSPREVRHHGISIGWRRSITGPFPGIELRIDGKLRPLSAGEANLLAKSIRVFLTAAAKTGADL